MTVGERAHRRDARLRIDRFGFLGESRPTDKPSDGRDYSVEIGPAAGPCALTDVRRA